MRGFPPAANGVVDFVVEFAFPVELLLLLRSVRLLFAHDSHAANGVRRDKGARACAIFTLIMRRGHFLI